jgi:hypothetical protein
MRQGDHHGRQELRTDRCSHFYDRRAFAARPRAFWLGHHDQRRCHSLVGKLARSGGRWRARGRRTYRVLKAVLVTHAIAAYARCTAVGPSW